MKLQRSPMGRAGSEELADSTPKLYKLVSDDVFFLDVRSDKHVYRLRMDGDEAEHVARQILKLREAV